MPRRGRTLAQQEARAGYALLSPTLIVVLFMVVLPILWTIVIAFQSLRLRNLRTRLFDFQLTLENFQTVLGSPGFLEALKVTLIYSIVGTFLSIALGLVAALVVRKPFKGRTLVRASMLLPYVAPVVAVTFVWQIMLNPELGIVNAIGTDVLSWKESIPFLEQRTGTLSVFGLDLKVPLALTVVILYQAWRYFPFSFLFILARLQALPGELDEAARVDGATPLQRFWRITFPQLQGVIALLAVLRLPDSASLCSHPCRSRPAACPRRPRRWPRTSSASSPTLLVRGANRGRAATTPPSASSRWGVPPWRSATTGPRRTGEPFGRPVRSRCHHRLRRADETAVPPLRQRYAGRHAAWRPSHPDRLPQRSPCRSQARDPEPQR